MAKETKLEMIIYRGPADDISKIEMLSRRHVGIEAIYKGKPINIKLPSGEKL